MSIVYQGTIQRVITLATVALELRSVCPTGLVETVLCTATRGMIRWVDKSVRLTEADFVPITGTVRVVASTVPPETTMQLCTPAIQRRDGKCVVKIGTGTTAPHTVFLKIVIGLVITTATR